MSEVVIQGGEAAKIWIWDHGGSAPGFVAAGTNVARNNLPVNSAVKLLQGEVPSGVDVASDLLAAVPLVPKGAIKAVGGYRTLNPADTIAEVRRAMNNRFSLGETMQAQRGVARTGKTVEFRESNAARQPGTAPKPGGPNGLSAKTVRSGEARLYPDTEPGLAVAKEPTLPENPTDVEVAAYNERATEWPKTEAQLKALEQRGYTRRDGKLYDPSGKVVGGDLDVRRVTNPDGTPVTTAESDALCKDMPAHGLHGAEATNPHIGEPGSPDYLAHMARLHEPGGNVVKPAYIPAAAHARLAGQGPEPSPAGGTPGEPPAGPVDHLGLESELNADSGGAP